MVALIMDNMAAIQDACKRHHVKSLYLFGSAVSEDSFDQASDIDFLYEIDIDNFKNWDTGEYDYLDNLDDLQTQLNKLLLRKIDLIPYNNIRNRFFKKSVDSSRQLIYAN